MKITLFALFLAASLAAKSAPTGEFVSFEFFDNRILIPAYLNNYNKESFALVLDTGASGSTLITPEVAKKLEMILVKGTPIGGAGDKKLNTQRGRLNQLAIGNLKLAAHDVIVADLSSIKKNMGFPALDGILGYEFLKRFTTTIYYETKTVRFESPSEFKAPEGATVIDFKWVNGRPVISGKIDTIDAQMMVDTGDRSAFTFYQKFATANNIGAKYQNLKPLLSGFGIGGPLMARLGEVDNLTMGNDVKLTHVMSRLPASKGGTFATSELSGSIGNEILRRFEVTFDYTNRKIYLRKTLSFDDPYLLPPVGKK